MSLKENLQAKIQLDRLVQKISRSLRETPGQRHVDRSLMRELLARSDFTTKKIRDLQLFVRPLQGETMEILVLDNELPIYHTTPEDVALRKSPEWKEMFSVKNIRKILNDQDVVATKGKESLNRIHENALGQLDLSYTREDLVELVTDGRYALEQESVQELQETLDLFFELLGFKPISLPVPQEDVQAFAVPRGNGGATPLFEHLLLFDEQNFWLGLIKGTFSPEDERHLTHVVECLRGNEAVDLQGVQVLEFMADLALKRGSAPPEKSAG